MLLLNSQVFAPVSSSKHALRFDNNAVAQHEVGCIGAVRKVFPLNLDLLVVVRDFEFVKVD